MTGRVQSLTVLFSLSLPENRRFNQLQIFSTHFKPSPSFFWLFVVPKYNTRSNSQLPSSKLHPATGPWDLFKKWPESHRLLWRVHLPFQYGHCPLPATSHWTHLSIPCTAAETIHSLCYQPSPALLPHPLSFLQNYFFITSFHLCLKNKSSGLCLTDLKVNSNQVKCSPSQG